MIKINKTKLIICFLLAGCFLAPLAKSQEETMEVVLNWTTDTFIPSDYPGKALPTRQSIVEVTTEIFPRKNINASRLFYYWFLNDQAQPDKSGQGKQTFSFRAGMDTYPQDTIYVKVKDENNELVLAESNRLILKIFTPEVIIKSGNTIQLSKKSEPSYTAKANSETLFTAQAYYFNIKNTSELSYNWKLEGQSANQFDKVPQFLTLKIGQVAESLKKTLTLLVRNKNSELENASNQTVITINP